MKTSFNLLAAATLAAGLFLAAGAVSAQSTAPASTTKTITGNFKSTDGNKGTYVRTIVTEGVTQTDTTVFTRASDQATATDVTTRTNQGNGVVVFNIKNTGFGETASYIATKTVTRQGRGNFAGTGTYTTPSGDSGTLTTLESNGAQVNVETTLRNSPKTGITEDLNLEDSEFGFTLVKHIVLSPDGTVKTTVSTRYITSVK